MNRKNLTAAVLAGLAGAAGIVGTAQAVNINPDGLGQVLIYPYYTSNNDLSTIFSVVNTTGYAKAIKVRFLEGMNSREVLDFNLYMSKYDVWTAAIYDNAGTPTLEVRDNTCTVPYIYGFGNLSSGVGGQQAFLNFAYSGVGATDGGPAGISRAAEGHFEVLEIGTLVDSVGGKASATAATHLTTGVPPDSTNEVTKVKGPCEQLIGAWSVYANGSPGYWGEDPKIDITTPRGGLFGSAGIVDVAEGAFYSYDPLAFNDWSRTAFSDTTYNAGIDGAMAIMGTKSLHAKPGSTLPSINSGDQLYGEVFLSNAIVPSQTLQKLFTRTVDGVSFTIQRNSLMNEYTTQSDMLAGTEWVVTFPTKNFYVDPAITAAVRAPFTKLFDKDFACEIIKFSLWDRNEQEKVGTTGGPIVSPPPPGEDEDTIELCYETNVIQFGSNALLSTTPSGILGSSNGISIDNEAIGSTFNEGWMSVDLYNYIDKTGAAKTRTHLGGLHGLPVTGFSVSEFTNNNAAPGIKATYGGLWQHKYTRMCSANESDWQSKGCQPPG